MYIPDDNKQNYRFCIVKSLVISWLVTVGLSRAINQRFDKGIINVFKQFNDITAYKSLVTVITIKYSPSLAII